MTKNDWLKIVEQCFQEVKVDQCLPTKGNDDQGSPHLFWEEYLVIQPELETCIIAGSAGVSFVPWKEVSVLASAEHIKPHA